MNSMSLLRSLSLGIILFLFCSASRAEDNTTMTVDGVTSNIGGAFTWGNTGANNLLAVTNAGVLVDTTAVIGNGAAARYNQATVIGSGSLWSNTSTVVVGQAGAYNQLTVAGAGTIKSVGISYIGSDASATGNVATVTGNGSLWTNAGALRVGWSGIGNELVISNGGTVGDAGATIGNNAAARNNKVTVTGTGSFWNNTGVLTVGNNGLTNELAILDGAKVVSVGTAVIGASVGANGNIVTVSGSGSLWTNSADIRLGGSGVGNRLVISEGGRVTSGSASGNVFVLGRSAGSDSNVLTITGSGSVLEGAAGVTVGNATKYNQAVISNGGKAWVTGSILVGTGAAALGNVLTVTGQGSMVTNSTDFSVGNSSTSNKVVITDGGEVRINGSLNVGISSGTNRVEIASGGILQVNTITLANFADNTLSNAGGIFQFGKMDPTISPNGYGRISLTDGTIAYRAITNANVRDSLGANQVGNILFAGNNVFRLNNSSNWTAINPQNYTFDSGISPSNYAGLEMINAGTAWKSAWLNVGSGGSMLVSNTAATIAGVVSNSGQIRVVNSSATWLSNVVAMGGTFTSLASTNTFSGALSINSGAALGGSGRVVTPDAIVAGTLSPGNSPGTLSFSSNLTLTAASTLVLEIAGTNAADYDHLLVDGLLTLAGTLTVTNLGHTFAAGDTFDFFDVGVPWTGAFSATNLPTLTGGLVWDFSAFESTGSLVVTGAIPETSTFAAIGAGLALLLFLRRRAV